MSDARSGSPGAGAGPGSRSTGPRRSRCGGDFQASVSRLQSAVDELVTTARDEFSDRASSFIDDTSQRLERELDRRQTRADARSRTDGRLRDDARSASNRDFDYGRVGSRRDPVPRRLYRGREKIGGVCSGIARYYGVEAWVVRCIAVTGLLFFPTIVFPAYWIAYFVMDKPPKPNGDPDEDRGRRGRLRRLGRRRRSRGHDGHGRNDHRSPAPELGPRFSPRYSLRNIQADLTEVELRLRRMETHVTSGQYELQRELNKIDGGRDERRD